MRIKRVQITEQYEDEKTNEYYIVADQTKSVYENALIALNVVNEKEYFSEAGISSPDDPDIYTNEDYPDILAENEKNICIAGGVSITLPV